MKVGWVRPSGRGEDAVADTEAAVHGHADPGRGGVVDVPPDGGGELLAQLPQRAAGSQVLLAAPGRLVLPRVEGGGGRVHRPAGGVADERARDEVGATGPHDRHLPGTGDGRHCGTPRRYGVERRGRKSVASAQFREHALSVGRESLPENRS